MAVQVRILRFWFWADIREKRLKFFPIAFLVLFKINSLGGTKNQTYRKT